MKIAIVCYPSIGGSGLVATELGLALAQRDYEVHFVSYSTPFKLRNYERNIFFHSVEGINYPLFNQSLYTFALTAKIIEVAEDHQIDVVHAHYSIPHSLCAHLAREISSRDFRVVTTPHGTDVTVVGQDKPLFPINRYGIQQSDAVTTVSDFQRQHTLRHFGIPNGVEVIYNFIDPAVFSPAAKSCCRSCWLDEPGEIVMHISNFREPKNPDGVIRGFYHLLQRRPKAYLFLVGDGPGITHIKGLCKELQICKRVRYLGKVENVEGVLPLADVLLQPSFRESFGMALLEGMACEVPAVASDRDGIPEVIVDGETGFLTDADDHEGMAERLAELLGNDALRRRFAKAGRERAVEHFHKDRIVPKYEACYQRVLAAAPAC